MINETANIVFIDEPETLSTYTYISNHLHFEYFVGYVKSSFDPCQKPALTDLRGVTTFSK